MREVVLFLALKYKNNWEKINKIIESGDFEIDWVLLNKIKQKINNNYLTFLDKDYPKSLKISENPPPIFYFYGNIEILNYQKIWIQGSKNNLNSIIELKKTLNFLENKQISIICEEEDDISSNFLNNSLINKIIITENLSQLNLDLSNDKTLFISSTPIENLYENLNQNSLSGDLLNFKSMLCDVLYFLSTKKTKINLQSIIFTIENHKSVFCLRTKDEDSDNNKLIKDGAIALSSIEELVKWKN